LDYQSNSKFSKEQREEKEKEPKVIEKVVTGTVVQKPKSFLVKVRNVFFGGDFKSTGLTIFSEVFLPAARNMLNDMWRISGERMIYGDSYRRYPPEPRGRTQYDMYGRSPLRSGYPPEPRTEYYGRTGLVPDQPRRPPYRTNRKDTDDIILNSRQDAENIVEELFTALEHYGVVSLGELKARLGLPSSPIDEKWGWTYLHDIQIRQVPQGYLIELPPMIDL